MVKFLLSQIIDSLFVALTQSAPIACGTAIGEVNRWAWKLTQSRKDRKAFILLFTHFAPLHKFRAY